MRRGFVLLAIALGALAMSSPAGAQVPKYGAGVGSPGSYVRTVATEACPTWETTADTWEHRESRCEVAPAPDASYACRSYNGYDENGMHTGGSSCWLTVAGAQAGRERNSKFTPQFGGPSAEACTVRAGDTEADLTGCSTEGGSQAWTTRCTTGPVTTTEDQFPKGGDSSHSIEAGGVEVRCSEQDEFDDTYEPESCGLGE